MNEPSELAMFLRAHTIRKGEDGPKIHRRGRPRVRHSEFTLLISCPGPLPDGRSKITGAYRVTRGGRLLHGGLICGDGSSDDELAAYRKALQDRPGRGESSSERLAVLRRKEFVRKVLLPSAFDLKATVIGFDLPVDLSNLSVNWSVARTEPYAGGFSLCLREYRDKQGKRRSDSYTPRIAVRGIDGRRAFIGFTSNRREPLSNSTGKGHKKPQPKRGTFLDCRTLAFALTGEDLDLDEACGSVGVKLELTMPRSSAIAQAADLSLQRLTKLEALYHVLAGLCGQASPSIPLEAVYSGASVGKHLLGQAGVRIPSMRADPALSLSPDQVNGWAMASYYGGRAECRIRGVTVPVVYCDFRSMYLTVCALMGVWDLLVAEEILVEDATEEVVRLLSEVTPEDLRSPKIWKDMLALVEVEPNGDVLPSRCKYGKSSHQVPSIAVNYVTSPFPLVYTLADCLAAKPLTGRAPVVRRAIRFRPIGRQVLRLISICGLPKMDPSSQDFFRWLVEARYAVKGQPGLSSQARDVLAGFLKNVAASTGYGIFIELNRIEDQPTELEVHSLDSYLAKVNSPEDPGPFYMPVAATLVTGGARLMLALAEERVSRLGGAYAFMDTDSIAIVSAETGGLIPCPGGPNRMPGGAEAVRALSWSEVDQVIADFAPLNPYDPALVPGSILKLEKENLGERTGEREPRRQLWCRAIIAKRYVLFNDEDSTLRIRKASKHTLGSYRPPRDPQTGEVVNDWIERAWEIILARATGKPPGELPAWVRCLAVRVLRASRPGMMEWFQPVVQGVKPFSLFEHTLPAPLHGLGSKAKESPVCLVRHVSTETGETSRWIDIHNPGGPTYRVVTGPRQGRDETTFVGETYGDLIEQHARRPEPKSADATGEPCSRSSVGVLTRRHIFVTEIKVIGKEANELDLIEAGLIADEDEYLTEYPRDIRDFLPEILQLIPAKSIQSTLNCSRSYAYSLRNGERKPGKSRQAKVVALAAQIARDKLREFNEPRIPANDEEAILRLVNCLRNKGDPTTSFSISRA